jgi:hypothetical protein
MEDFISPLSTLRIEKSPFRVAPLYPKLVADLSFEILLEGDADVTFPPDSIVARIDVIHLAGLQGEYEWLKLFGRDIKPATGKKRIAKIKESLPENLRLIGYYKLRIRGLALSLRLGSGLAQYFPSTKLNLIDKAGKAKKIYDQKYNSPLGGVREIDDAVIPELPPFGP